MINYKEIEQWKINREIDQRRLIGLQKKYNYLYNNFFQSNVQAFQIERPPSSHKSRGDIIELTEFDRISHEIADLNDLIENYDKNIDYMTNRIQDYLERTGDIESYVYIEVYNNGKRLKEIAEIPPHFWAYQTLKNASSRIRKQIEGESYGNIT